MMIMGVFTGLVGTPGSCAGGSSACTHNSGRGHSRHLQSIAVGDTWQTQLRCAALWHPENLSQHIAMGDGPRLLRVQLELGTNL